MAEQLRRERLPKEMGDEIIAAARLLLEKTVQRNLGAGYRTPAAC